MPIRDDRCGAEHGDNSSEKGTATGTPDLPKRRFVRTQVTTITCLSPSSSPSSRCDLCKPACLGVAPNSIT